MYGAYGDLVYPFAVEAKKGERFAAIPFEFNLSANEAQSKTYTLSTGWNFIASILNSYSTGPFKLQITDVYSSADLFVSEVRGSLVTGTGERFFIMPKEHKFGGGRTIQVTVRDISGAANNVEVVLIGYKESIFCKPVEIEKVAPSKTTKYGKEAIQAVRYMVDRLFVVPFNFSLDANETKFIKYPVSKGFDFMWEVLNSYSSVADYTLQIKDEYVTEEFFTSPLRASTVTGTGQRPFILPRPYIFEGGTHITVTVNEITGNPANIQLVFIGYKVKKVE